MSNIVRSSHHSIKFLTNFKASEYFRFLDNYQQAVIEVIEQIWNNPYHWMYGGSPRIFDISKDLLDLPVFGTTVKYFQPLNSTLSYRVYKFIIKQAFDIVRSQVAVRRNLLFVRSKLLEKGESTEKVDQLLKSKSKQLTKPIIHTVNPELCSDNCEFLDKKELEKLANRRCYDPQSHFDGFLELKHLGDYGDDLELVNYERHKIRIPIQFHRGSNQLIKRGYQIKTSFSLGRDSVTIRWEQTEPPKKTKGEVVGIDTGRKHTLSCSNGIQITTDKHGWTLDKIVKVLESLDNKNSRKFKRFRAFQICFIGWAVNKLSLDEIMEIRLEDVKGMGNISKYWYYPMIRQRIQMRAEEESVALKLQSSGYRSQRCCQCGYVHRLNRNGEGFNCRACGRFEQADLNAARNHLGYLPKCDRKLLERQKISKKEGFYWLADGIWSLSERQEQLGISVLDDTVPVNKKKRSKQAKPEKIQSNGLNL